jgi:hypothetical protein
MKQVFVIPRYKVGESVTGIRISSFLSCLLDCFLRERAWEVVTVLPGFPHGRRLERDGTQGGQGLGLFGKKSCLKSENGVEEGGQHL